MEDNTNVNAAILERLEKVVQSLQENSVKMGELLAVHNEKLDKQDRIDAVLFEKIESLHKDMGRATDEIKKGCERDIRLVDLSHPFFISFVARSISLCKDSIFSKRTASIRSCLSNFSL